MKRVIVLNATYNIDDVHKMRHDHSSSTILDTESGKHILNTHGSPEGTILPDVSLEELASGYFDYVITCYPKQVKEHYRNLGIELNVFFPTHDKTVINCASLSTISGKKRVVFFIGDSDAEVDSLRQPGIVSVPTHSIIK